MPDLFGLDIAGIIDDAIVGAGGVLTGTLHKRTAGTRTPGDLTSGVNPTDTDVSFRGFIERKTDVRLADSLVTQDGERLTILGNSLGGVEPESGDEVTIENQRFTITRIRSRDPAAAVFVCDIES